MITSGTLHSPSSETVTVLMYTETHILFQFFHWWEKTPREGKLTTPLNEKKYSYLRISGFPDCLHIYINLLSLKILSNIWKYHHFLNFLPPDHLTISSQVSKTNIRELKKNENYGKNGSWNHISLKQKYLMMLCKEGVIHFLIFFHHQHVLFPLPLAVILRFYNL